MTTQLLAALMDGEDFELLFTIASKDAVPLLDVWMKQFPVTRLTYIGKITAGSGMAWRDAAQRGRCGSEQCGGRQ